MLVADEQGLDLRNYELKHNVTERIKNKREKKRQVDGGVVSAYKVKEMN
jgi:hypothetical protein